MENLIFIEPNISQSDWPDQTTHKWTNKRQRNVIKTVFLRVLACFTVQNINFQSVESVYIHSAEQRISQQVYCHGICTFHLRLLFYVEPKGKIMTRCVFSGSFFSVLWANNNIRRCKCVAEQLKEIERSESEILKLALCRLDDNNVELVSK